MTSKVNLDLGMIAPQLLFLILLISMAGVSIVNAARMLGKTVLVTGSTDGIGQHTAFKLARDGAQVLLHGRSQQRLETTKASILKQHPAAQLETYCYDLQTIGAVKALSQEILSKHDKLDVLINNAGVFQETRLLTSDGLESTFAINVAATFILICALFPILKCTPQSIILNVSSISQSDLGTIDLSNLQFEKGGFSNYNSYSLSKLCVAAISHELALRISAEDALVLSCDPGTVNTKMLQAGWGNCGIDISQANHEYQLVTRDYLFQDVTTLASTSINTGSASSSSTGLETPILAKAAHGRYFVGGRMSQCCRDVYNDDIRIGLWERLEEIVGMTLPI